MESTSTRYWCHVCSQVVNATNLDVEPKCPLCLGGFVEVMDSSQSLDELTSDSALSLWAPILLNVMGNARTRRRFRRSFLLDDDDDDAGNDPSREEEGGETELDRELELIIQRNRSSSTILQLLHSMRAGLLAAESENDRRRESEHLILINPFTQPQPIDLQGRRGAYGSNQDDNPFRNPMGTLSDYFLGPGLELLLQHLTENDPNRYGTPPAQNDVIEALPTVKLDESLPCAVCLDDCEVGSEAMEMPCKHKFHRGCILPWLEMHSSCPVCRFQLPADVSKLDLQVDSNNDNVGGHGIGNSSSIVGRDSREGPDAPSERRFALPWPLSTLFSSSASQSNANGANSSLSQSSSGATNAARSNGG